MLTMAVNQKHNIVLEKLLQTGKGNRNKMTPLLIILNSYS